jgi:uncharacterized protein YecT (DUF1311 family)
MKTVFLCAAWIAAIAIQAVAADGGSDLAKARRHFETADAVLNKTYRAVCKELSGAKLAELRTKQRDWLQYRDEMADARSLSDKAMEARRRPDYWEVMASLTEERAEYLSAYTGKNVPAGIRGEYHDSYGGILLLDEQQGRVAFSIEVVRGRASNEGSLDGLAILKKNGQAHFKDRADPSDPGEPCEITFTFIDSHIVTVEEKNAQKYQGNNAHFDGWYYKTGNLKEPIKLEDAALSAP